MTGVRALLLAMTCPNGDVAGNLAVHRAVLADAAALGADVVVFPEFSLTGSVHPGTHPEHAVGVHDPAVRALVKATGSVAAVFGIAERDGERFFITQLAAAAGEVVDVQRKRHLGEGEERYSTGATTATFTLAGRTCGVVICAEAGVDWPWNACVQAGAELIFFCSAPGLYGRRTDEAGWRAGLDWWESCGLADARRHAGRLGVWVAMSTQAGSTADEDFPGLAALISPYGEVLDRTPDWRPGQLLVDIPCVAP